MQQQYNLIKLGEKKILSDYLLKIEAQFKLNKRRKKNKKQKTKNKKTCCALQWNTCRGTVSSQSQQDKYWQVSTNPFSQIHLHRFLQAWIATKASPPLQTLYVHKSPNNKTKTQLLKELHLHLSLFLILVSTLPTTTRPLLLLLLPLPLLLHGTTQKNLNMALDC